MLRILKTINDLQDIRSLYDSFDVPVAALDCGQKCSLHNPTGKPFCCDICHAVPAAYQSEWRYLQPSTDLWHAYRGDECQSESAATVKKLEADTPKNMILLACLGPNLCQRKFRALSCRQFPFFPYITADYRFIGLTYEWEFEDRCWVASNLSHVTRAYREEFIRTFDRILALFQDEFDSYAYHSQKLREHYRRQKKRFPLLHRNGGAYLVSPKSGRMAKTDPGTLPKFGYYK